MNKKRGEKLLADRDHWRAEAENLKIENEMLYAWKHKHEEELAAATALAEKYRKERDELIEVLQMAIDVTDEKQYPETQGIMIRAILKIQEEDK